MNENEQRRPSPIFCTNTERIFRLRTREQECLVSEDTCEQGDEQPGNLSAAQHPGRHMDRGTSRMPAPG